MTDLIKLFKHRDDILHEETKNILDNIPHVIQGATSFIDKQYGPDNNRTLVWEDVNLFDESITLLGIVSYTPGTRLMLNGEMMDVTSDNSEYFQQIIRVGIPLRVANMPNEQDVVKYLDSLQELEDNIHKEFDMSNLTEEQQQALKEQQTTTEHKPTQLH